MRDKLLPQKNSTKFQAAIDTFADCGWDKYKSEADIIDELWPRIQCPGLVSYIEATKIAQLRIPVKYKILLQNIATHLPSISGKTNTSSNISELGHQADVRYPKEGPDTLSEVFNSDGNIFIG